MVSRNDPADAGSPGDAMATVRTVAASVEQAALLRLGLTSGLFAHCRDLATLDQLAVALDAPRARVADVCDALAALGALQREGEAVRLAPMWSSVGEGGLDVMAQRVLRGAAARAELIADALTGAGTYWEIEPALRRAVAESVALPPSTPFGATAARSLVASLPMAEKVLAAGGSWLELGCGVAGMLLSLIRIFPAAHGVGVELASDLVALGRADAEALGLTERVDLVAGDATTYRTSERFDVVFWSQFSFPRATRAAALAVAWAHLRPGGTLLCPTLPSDDGSPLGRERVARTAPLSAVLGDSWGSPVVPFEELRAEIVAAGFVDVPADARQLRGPLSARRPGREQSAT